MRYPKGSIEFDINVYALHEAEDVVPMTRSERKALRNWVYSGHELESNPWHYIDAQGYELNYLEAYRIINGYSSGPWDFWRGSSDQLL